MGHFLVLPATVANSGFKNPRLPSHTNTPGWLQVAVANLDTQRRYKCRWGAEALPHFSRKPHSHIPALWIESIQTACLAGHTLSQERVWYFTMQRFVPDPMTFVGCFPPNVYVVCVLCDCVYTLQPLSARTISCTVMYQTLS